MFACGTIHTTVFYFTSVTFLYIVYPCQHNNTYKFMQLISISSVKRLILPSNRKYVTG